MKMMQIAGTDLQVSRIALGCMRLAQKSTAEAERLVRSALEEGVNFFDHADIYGGGRSEEIFAQAAGAIPSWRERMLIQSKCGICKGYFDFSKEHILESVDGILRRLRTDYLDVLLLHRPDALMEPQEVAEAFAQLHAQGKVRYFGVSNHNPGQIELLRKYLPYQLIFNQLQLSATNSTMIGAGLHVNMEDPAAVGRDGGVLDYCRLHEITIQPWSPFQYGNFEGVFIGSERYPLLNAKLDELGERYHVSASAVALAWILRHPAGMQPIVGTTSETRLRTLCRAAEIELSRLEWYEIYRAAGNTLP